jgi:hypothetical protein
MRARHLASGFSVKRLSPRGISALLDSGSRPQDQRGRMGRAKGFAWDAAVVMAKRIQGEGR